MLQRKKKKLLLLTGVLFITGLSLNSGFSKKNTIQSGLDISPASAENLQPITFGSDVFVKIVEAEKPAVVNISAKGKSKHPQSKKRFNHNGPYDDPFQEFFDRFFDGQRGHRGEIPDIPRKNLGSGFIIDKEGYIFTNNHVVEGADEIKVTLDNDKEFNAKLIGSDPKTDIALIKIEPKKDLPVVDLGDSDTLRVGEWVVAIGNPFGLSQTVTVGVVSAKERNIGSGPYDNYIQTDASINPGNSGGPLINSQGKVVGINSAIYSGSGGNIGIGFAIPINMALHILKDLKEKGSVTRGWLGVYIQEITPQLARSLNLKGEDGALVGDVIKDGPAEKSGIKRGDVILEFNGEKIKAMKELPLIVAQARPDTKASVLVLRDGKKKVIKVDLGTLKNEEAAVSPHNEEKVGIRVKELTPEIIQNYNLDDDEGVIVSTVIPGSPADEGGIMRGDIIIEINQKPIKSVDDYKSKIHPIEKGDILFLIKRRNRAHFIGITIK